MTAAFVLIFYFLQMYPRKKICIVNIQEQSFFLYGP